MNITQFIDRETAATPIGPPLTVATAAAVLIAAGAVALAVETPSSAAVVTAVPLAV